MYPENKNRTYVGLAMSSTMFPQDCLISRQTLTVDETKERLSGQVISCFNPSHAATIEALHTRFEIEVEIPETAPKVSLEPGDTLIVLSAQFTRRLNEGGKYTREEVESASFEFVEYRIFPRASHFVAKRIDTTGQFIADAEKEQPLGYIS